jgi:glycerate 2-kinase
MTHAFLSRLHRAAIEGVLPFPHTRDATAAWLAGRSSVSPVHVLALGKAAPDMARGAIAALQERGEACAGGLIVAAHRPADGTVLPMRVGDHPLPDVGSLAAADAIAATIAQCGAGDDVLVLLSGGTSSLCAAPCAEFTALVGHPADAQRLIAEAMDAMMAQGLAIHEMNAIRRRLLRWSAGRLATALHARGVRHIHVMAISDVIGDDPAVIGSAPCTADPLDQEAVLAICDAQGVRSLFNPTLARALGLSGDGSVAITPPRVDHPAFQRVTYTVIAGNDDARRAVEREAHAAGVEEVILADDPLEGDAEWLGSALAQVALRHAHNHHGASVLVWGGEPTVRLNDVFRFDERDDEGDDEPDDNGDSSAQHPHARVSEANARALIPELFALHPELARPKGGRMQALALASALYLDNIARADRDAERISILAMGTDGRDGPTDAAGAIVDAGTAMAIRRAGRDPMRDLQQLSSYDALDAGGALLRSGPTGTNVMDVVAVFIAPARA